MSIPERFYVTPYYKNRTQHDLDTAPLFRDSHRAYDVQRTDIIQAWALGCSEVVNKEAKFTMTFMGHLFLETYLSTDTDSWNSGVFPPWVEYVYKPCAETFYWKANNQGSWGILGCILSDIVLGRDCKRHEQRIAQHMSYSWDELGVMTQAVKRTNSGIWYSYFSLAPLLRACHLLKSPLIEYLKVPLRWLFHYTLFPDKWPYRPRTGILGWLQRMLYPHSDKLELPRRNDWPANLFLAAGQHFGEQEWIDYAQRPFNEGIHIFRETYFK